MTTDATDYIAEAITAHWGERCAEPITPDPDDPNDPGCAVCNAWAQYDALKRAALDQQAKGG